MTPVSAATTRHLASAGTAGEGETTAAGRGPAIAAAVLAAGAGAYFVLRNPAVREVTWRAVRNAVTVTLPGMLMHELSQAWAAAGTGR